MKALNLHDIDDLRYEDVILEPRNNDEVTVHIKAAGICGSDIARVFTKGTYNFPTIPGHEFSGTIIEADNQEFIGKNVAVFPLIPCGKCNYCQIGEYEICDKYDYYGSRRDGGFAEFLNVKTDNLVFLPDGMNLEMAAMCEPGAVGLHALRCGNVKAMDNVVIWGIGTIGFILAYWLRVFGAKNIIMIARDDHKVRFANKLGFKNIINSNLIDPIEYILDITNGIGADVCIEGTGNIEALEYCIKASRKHGSVVCMGNPNSDMNLAKDVYWQILRKQLHLIGTWNSSFNNIKNDWKDTIQAMYSDALPLENLITHRFKLDEFEQAFSIMKERSEYYCKVMFINS
ncbi:MAG: galactitol-1-phosphate 5-dehydrogenase [Acidaminococcaceae bacterium]|nr:galactitol-1-phosphate 5-dehydrogenase [Acidaminococcaceae bacterium]